MATAFDDLIPQSKKTGSDPFGDLVPAKPSLIDRAGSALSNVFHRVVDAVENSPAQQIVRANQAAHRPMPDAFSSVAEAVPPMDIATAPGAATFRRAATRGVIPTLAGAGGFGAGAAAGGTLTAPAEAIPIAGPVINGLGALVGGLLGAYGASSATDVVQDKAISALPVNVQEAIGQDEATRRADAQQHPIAAFSGGLAPSLLTMRPGFSALPVAEDAPILTRILAHPAGGAAVGASLGGAQEAAREEVTGEGLDPAKIAIATGVGAAENRPTRLGSKLFEIGGNGAVINMQRAARGAGYAREAVMGRDDQRARQDYDVQASATDMGREPFTQLPAPRPEPAPNAEVPRGSAVPTPANDAFADLVPASPEPGPVAPSEAQAEPQPTIGAAAAEGGAVGNAGAAAAAPAPAAAPGIATATAQPSEPQPLQDGEQYVRTPAGNKVRTRMEVVDASTLNKATGDLQNRDRSRDTTALQVQDIIGKFDPELLGSDPSSDRGAPIVHPDDTVLSGNGRMLALNEIFDSHPDKAAAYRQFIEAQGHSTDGIARPVLIRRVTQDMTPEEARAFVVESNKDNKLELSPVERARSDADSVTPEMLARYGGGDLNSTANAGFVEAFTKSLTAGEMGNVIGSDRRLTTAGIERIENAVVAKAYDHPKLLEKLMESSHHEIRSITSALANVAPAWAQMRAAASAGEIGKHYDITADLADAAMRVANARRTGTKPVDLLTQHDAFDPMSPVTSALIEGFYVPNKKGDDFNAASSKKVTDFLQGYIDEANGQKPSTDIFGGTTSGKEPVDILKELLRQRDKNGGDTLFDAPTTKENAHVPRTDPAAREPQGAPSGRGHSEADARPDPAAHDRAGSREGSALDASASSGGRSAASSRADVRVKSDGGEQRADGLAERDRRDARPEAADDGEQPSRAGRDHLKENVNEPERTRGDEERGQGRDAEAQGEATPEAKGERAAASEPERRDGGKPAAAGRAGATDRGGVRPPALDALDLDTEEDATSYGPVKAEGAYKDSFEKASFTDRASIYQAAAEAAGLDADRFRLLPAPRQVALLQRAMAQRFGLRVDVDKGMQERFAIDQMLDAFQNAQGMAHILSLPSRAISLDGKLALRLQKKGNFLGAYSPGASQIILPKRSNSFAHEWGHALDYHLLRLTGADGKGLTGAVRAEGKGVSNDALPSDVRGAFVDLLNALFFDKAAVAERIMQLEKKIAATKSANQRTALTAQLERLKDGSSKARGIGTKFHNNAKTFDGEGGDYWTSPTEMFARAFEAYVSYTADAYGLGTEFIGKGDANYLDGAGERFEKTFPKGEERAVIFAAFDNLMGAIAQHELTASGPAAERPTGPVSRITDLDKTPNVKRERNVIRNEVNAIRRDVARLRREKEGRIANPKGRLEKAADLNAAVFGSMAGNLRMIQARSGSPSLQKLIDLLTKQDGRGDRTVARTFHEDVHIRSKQSINRLANILKAHDAEDLDADDSRMLRDLLTQTDVPPAGAPDNLVKAAAAIRQLLDHEFYENQKAGIDLGYTRNGYLSRVLDLPRVWNDQEGFVSDASKVYEVVFDNAFHSPEAVAASEELLPRFLKLARVLAKNGHDVDPGPVRAILKQMKKVDDAIARAKAKGEDYGDLEGKFAKLDEELGEAMGELWDQVRPAFAKERAEAWLGKINLTAGEEHNAAAPDSKYTKHRDLPPEADKLMEKFYLQDPVEAVVNYLTTSARRTAYAKRFGHDGAKRKKLFEAMAAEGVGPDDQRTVSRILDTATGRRRSELPKAVQDGLGVINAAGVMVLLPRAVLSSLAEPFTAGLVTGSPMDGFGIIARQIGQALGSPSGKVRYELARAMGIVSDMASDGIMEARYGQTYADELRSHKFVSTMFRRTGLTWLTRSQKTAGVGLAHAFLDNLAQQVGKGGKPREHAIALMRELGIRDPEAFAKQLLALGRLPTVEELDSEFGHDYATAQLRFGTMVIQEPSAMDRPELSQNPAGRVIYGITGFSYGYWRNIIKRNGILLAEMAKRDGPRAALYAGALAASAAVAFLMQATVSVIRERLLNPKRWHDLEQKGQLESTMAELAFTRTFSFGGADPVIQSYTGLKYQRDLSNLFIGPGPGFFVQNAQKMLQPTISNSRKNNTAEYNALQGAYSAASPLAAFGLARLPGGPAVDIATGIGMGYVTSAAARDQFATAVVGPKNGSLGPDGKTVKSGPTALDRGLNDMFGEPPKKAKTQ